MNFEDLFIDSKGQPVTYKNELLYLLYNYPLARHEQKFKLSFERVSGEWKQGIIIKTKDKGKIILNDDKEIDKAVVLWSDTSPSDLSFQVVTQEDVFLVYNVWDVGNGTVHSWHNGAAIKVEELQNGYRFHCNDGFPDEDFDDLVFSITTLAP